MGGLPASPIRPKPDRTRSPQACAVGPTGWRVLECLSGQCQLAPLRERGCHDGVKAFVDVCIYMRAVVLRGPAALPVLLDPADLVEPIQPHEIAGGRILRHAYPPADRVRDETRAAKYTPFQNACKARSRADMDDLPRPTSERAAADDPIPLRTLDVGRQRR